MKTTNPDIQKIIDYLNLHLCEKREERYKFEKIGPREFIFSDHDGSDEQGGYTEGVWRNSNIDTIIVKVTDNNLIILSGGHGAIDCMEMIPILPIMGDAIPIREIEEIINESYLQPILHKF